uniref:Putative secreted protein n=1 Tax=Anopheles marajoara TaxID=58244 RepID=A0A2M4CFB0_9DIPT
MSLAPFEHLQRLTFHCHLCWFCCLTCCANMQATCCARTCDSGSMDMKFGISILNIILIIGEQLRCTV